MSVANIRASIEAYVAAWNETDAAKRDSLIHRALVLTNEDVAVLPLYRSIGAWAMRTTVHATYRADTVLAAKSVRVDE